MLREGQGWICRMPDPHLTLTRFLKANIFQSHNTTSHAFISIYTVSVNCKTKLITESEQNSKPKRECRVLFGKETSSVPHLSLERIHQAYKYIRLHSWLPRNVEHVDAKEGFAIGILIAHPLPQIGMSPKFHYFPDHIPKS